MSVILDNLDVPNPAETKARARIASLLALRFGECRFLDQAGFYCREATSSETSSWCPVHRQLCTQKSAPRWAPQVGL